MLFLLFAFGISWISAGIVYLAGFPYGSTLSLAVTATLYMMAPALAAIIVQKSIYRLPLKELGLDFKKTKWKNMLWIALVQLLLCVFSIGFIILFGNALHMEAFGFYSFDPEMLNQRFREISEAQGLSATPNIPIPPMALLIITIGSSILFGGFINGIFTFGEELGWRGFLYNETKKLGFWKSNLLIGTIWGLWHAPLILQGHNYPEHPVAGVFMMVPFCISLAFLLSWTRLKTNSVLAPALLHGMVNAGAGGIMLFAYGYNDLIGNIAGAAGVLGALLTLLVILFFDKKTITEMNKKDEIEEEGPAI